MASNYLRRARSAEIQVSRGRKTASPHKREPSKNSAERLPLNEEELRQEGPGRFFTEDELRERARRGSGFTTDPTNDVIPPQISPERSAFLKRAKDKDV